MKKAKIRNPYNQESYLNQETLINVGLHKQITLDTGAII